MHFEVGLPAEWGVVEPGRNRDLIDGLTFRRSASTLNIAVGTFAERMGEAVEEAARRAVIMIVDAILPNDSARNGTQRTTGE